MADIHVKYKQWNPPSGGPHREKKLDFRRDFSIPLASWWSLISIHHYQHCETWIVASSIILDFVSFGITKSRSVYGHSARRETLIYSWEQKLKCKYINTFISYFLKKRKNIFEISALFFIFANNKIRQKTKQENSKYLGMSFWIFPLWISLKQ